MQTKQLGKSHTTCEKVKVFLRINNSKKGTDFICDSSITQSKLVETLLKVISQNKFLKKACIDLMDRTQFVLQGHKIDANSQNEILLRQNHIIHAINDLDTHKQQIHVTFRYQNPQNGQDIVHQVQVDASKTIEEQTQKIAPLYFTKFVNQVTLVYLGTQLSPVSTFREAKIQDHSQIIVIDKLKNEKQQFDPFENAQEIPREVFTFKPRKIQIEAKDSVEIMGLNMPYNPKIEANRVKKLLEQNVIENQLFMQNQHPLLLQNPQAPPLIHIENQLLRNQPPLHISTEQIGQKIDEEKNIPTKQQIEEQKPSQKIQEEK